MVAGLPLAQYGDTGSAAAPFGSDKAAEAIDGRFRVCGRFSAHELFEQGEHGGLAGAQAD